MKQYIEAAKNYTNTYKKELTIGLAVIATAALLVTVIALYVINTIPKVVYQPTNACSLFTMAEAKAALGPKTVKSSEKSPVLTGNTASSNCGYTDGNTDTENMIVAAIIVRSGINDTGVEQNNAEFDTSRQTQKTVDVKDLGDKAFFNEDRGQLNVLNGREWVILNYGIGSAPEANTVEKAVELAQKMLQEGNA